MGHTIIRFRALTAAVACVATMMLLGAGVADAASSPAVTGRAGDMTSTSVQLNGVVEPAGLDTFWAFQYGTSASYGKVTAPVGPLTGTISMSVSTLITGLRPGTTYHFRVVAVQGAAAASGESSGYAGSDATFTTPSSGSSAANGARRARASLRSHTLTVRHGVTLIPWACSGARGAVCRGKISLTTQFRLGGKAETASCGGGAFSASTGKHRSVRATLGSTCLSLLGTASHHRLSASLKAAFSEGAGSLRTMVTLVL